MQLDAALPIVRALADGVNPVTGEAYPDHSSYAEPRTLRALYSAVDLMQKEVERERRRERLPANFGKPWTEGEDHVLTREFDAGMPIKRLKAARAYGVGTVRHGPPLAEEMQEAAPLLSPSGTGATRQHRSRTWRWSDVLKNVRVELIRTEWEDYLPLDVGNHDLRIKAFSRAPR